MNRIIYPAPGKVLLRKLKKEEKKGNLIIPNQSEKGTPIYLIENVSDEEGYWEIEEMVILSHNYPILIEMDDQVYYMVNSEDILGNVCEE